MGTRVNVCQPLRPLRPCHFVHSKFYENDLSADHYEMIGKVAFCVSKPGGGCTGCVAVNFSQRPWFKYRVFFWSHPPPPPPPSRGQNV